MYDRLVPRINGKRKFSTIQQRRLVRLGITKIDPDSLTMDEIAKFSRLNIDPLNVVWTRGIRFQNLIDNIIFNINDSI